MLSYTVNDNGPVLMTAKVELCKGLICKEYQLYVHHGRPHIRFPRDNWTDSLKNKHNSSYMEIRPSLSKKILADMVAKYNNYPTVIDSDRQLPMPAGRKADAN